jgi:hypothetical protein
VLDEAASKETVAHYITSDAGRMPPETSRARKSVSRSCRVLARRTVHTGHSGGWDGTGLAPSTLVDPETAEGPSVASVPWTELAGGPFGVIVLAVASPCAAGGRGSAPMTITVRRVWGEISHVVRVSAALIRRISLGRRRWQNIPALWHILPATVGRGPAATESNGRAPSTHSRGTPTEGHSRLLALQPPVPATTTTTSSGGTCHSHSRRHSWRGLLAVKSSFA